MVAVYVNIRQPAKITSAKMQRKRATSLQIDGQIQSDGEHDFVPEHLVSPFPVQSRLKSKAHLQRVYNDDFIDMGVIPPAKHPSLVYRRQSDPGRISPAARHNRYGGSCSSSDDEEYERSPRSHSPRHFVGPVPEEEGGYLTGGLDGRLSPGLSSSPRRRLVHQRYSASLPMNALMGDESPRIRPRAFRSNSLPLQFMPFEVGEAVGALAKVKVSPDVIKRNRLPDGAKSGNVAATQVSSAKRTHINRWVSIEEPLLESILEENGTRISKPRRLSMPQCFSSEKYSKTLP